MDGPPRAYHLGFALGPRINAGGRIGDAGLGARLLTLSDTIEAARIARELDRLNAERQGIEKQALEEAIAQAEAQFHRSNRLHCLVVEGEDWHPGVVGLIAARLKERFSVPSFAFAFNSETGSGSGRSLSGVDAAIVGEAHVRARLRSGDGASVDAIAFRVVGSPLGDALLRGRGELFHVAARFSASQFRGVERVETRIADLARA